jgi:threonine/homoserine/homoserine lactone efflux protein
MNDLVLFALASAALLLTPGPTNTLLATSAAMVGARRSCSLILMELAGYGLSIAILLSFGQTVLATFPSVTQAVRFGLSIYLFYLAGRLWSANPHLSASPITRSRVFVTTLLNPKGLVFSFVIFPPITSVKTATVHAVLFAAITSCVAAGWIIGGAFVGAMILKARMRLMARASAAALAIFGLVLMATVVTK